MVTTVSEHGGWIHAFCTCESQYDDQTLAGAHVEKDSTNSGTECQSKENSPLLFLPLCSYSFKTTREAGALQHLTSQTDFRQSMSETARGISERHADEEGGWRVRRKQRHSARRKIQARSGGDRRGNWVEPKKLYLCPCRRLHVG